MKDISVEPHNVDTQMPVISVQAFGGLSILYEGAPVTICWESQKARMLFCYLLVSYDQWIHRDKLIEALWPGCDPVAGSQNFKTTLSRLRKSFAGPRTLNPVICQGEAFRLNVQHISLDASRFKHAALTGIKCHARGDSSTARQFLESAQDFYTGEFLPEEPFNDSISAERRYLAQLHTSVIILLEKIYEEEGNSTAVEAISMLRKLATLGEPA
jgi:DNA-binding SARP family transcriptional activator